MDCTPYNDLFLLLPVLDVQIKKKVPEALKNRKN